MSIPRGVALDPRLDGYAVTPAEDTEFVYQGWVDLAPGEGRIFIDVLADGNGSASTGVWTQVASALPSEVSHEIEGDTFYRWATPRLGLFKASGQNRWPEGGTARVRFRAVASEDGETVTSFLPVLDANSNLARPQLILADMDPTPATLDDLSRRPSYLSKKPALSTEETDNYYSKIGTSPTGGGPSISAAFPNLGAFIDRYFDTIPAECARRSLPEATTTYFNHADLGFGREMHCIYNGCENKQESACYVENFGNDGGDAIFNDFDGAFEITRDAVAAHLPFATVAMVERGRMPPRAPNKVFFAVFDHNDAPPIPPHPPDRIRNATLTNEAQLDSRGQNKFIPGNCLVCHGSHGSYTAGTALVEGAFFLPFDLESFKYYSEDTENPLSRQAQEAAFKRQNTIVYFTDLFLSAAARELILGWYDGSGFPSTEFNDGFVPEDWDENFNTRRLYREVVAKTCRTCHISNTVSELTWGSFASFKSMMGLIYADACLLHSMPNAEQSSNLFWKSASRPQLLNRLGLPSGCGLPAVTTTAGFAPRSARAGSTLEAVLDYQAQTCACTTADCLDRVEAQLLSELSAVGIDDSAVGEHIDSILADALDCRLEVLQAGSDAQAGDDLELEARRERERERVLTRQAALLRKDPSGTRQGRSPLD